MKQVFLNVFLLSIAGSFFSSCVAVKKFKALEEEKLKIETTLLSTKEKLSVAKRELNKLKDSSTSNSEEQGDVIKGLKEELDESQHALDAAQGAVVSCQQELHQLNSQSKKQEKTSRKQLVPFLDVQKNLAKQNKSLNSIQEDFHKLLEESPEIKMTILLYKDELTLSFDHSYLFSSSGRSLSEGGRLGLYKLAEVLKKHPTVYIDINGHLAAGGDKKENWKNSTRKTLSIIYTLTHKEVLPDRMRLIAYGENLPIASNENSEGKLKNNRSEIVLHYQNMKLLKLIPLK